MCIYICNVPQIRTGGPGRFRGRFRGQLRPVPPARGQFRARGRFRGRFRTVRIPQTVSQVPCVASPVRVASSAGSLARSLVPGSPDGRTTSVYVTCPTCNAAQFCDARAHLPPVSLAHHTHTCTYNHASVVYM